MADRENVIKVLGECAEDDCVSVLVPRDIVEDVLELLKAQAAELEELKLCKHKCKIDCLLKEYNKISDELKEMKQDYEDMREDLQDTLKDNLRLQELVDTQEPIAPIFDEHESWDGDYYKCGACGYLLGKESKYCLMCGRAVKWDARQMAAENESP